MLSTDHARRWGRSRSQSIQDRIELVVAEWHPYCPGQHELPDTLEEVQVIAIIGNVYSSKSHYLAGLVYELINLQPFLPFGLEVSYVSDSGSDMDDRIKTIYTKHQVLPVTERGKVYGPHIYRVKRRAGMLEETNILAFFDVAGEDSTSLRTAANLVRYLFDAAGIILLLDPDGLPREDSILESHNPNAPLASRALIDTLSEVITQGTGQSPRYRNQRLVVAMSKADKLRIPETIYPPPSLAGHSRRSVQKLLTRYSERSAAEISELGARGIVEAAINAFGKSNVMFGFVSATGEDPVNGSWVNPRPVGCAMPLAELLLTRNLT